MDNGLKGLLEETLGERITVFPLHGGIVETLSGGHFFLKKGQPDKVFLCEARGLDELARVKEVNVPAVISRGHDHILTSYVEETPRPADFYSRLGAMVARMHRAAGSRFGFYEDNFIGRNPQRNIAVGNEATHWAEFYYGKRLDFQLRLAMSNGYGEYFTPAHIARLKKKCFSLLEPVDEPPSLLHGDLWAGNYLCGAEGKPYLIDPAVYYGHRETDIAMTMLFGGFPAEFYSAYHREFPLSEGWRERISLYQLYHVLNHLNLFGAGYLRQAMEIIDSL